MQQLFSLSLFDDALFHQKRLSKTSMLTLARGCGRVG
jgi:hypothetical protein